MKNLKYLKASMLLLPLLMITGCGDDPVNEDNHLPTVSILSVEQTVNAGEKATVTAKAFDVDDDPLTYLWSIKSRPTGSEAELSNSRTKRVSIVTDKGGNYILSFVANDGFSDSKTVTATVHASSPDPVAPDIDGDNRDDGKNSNATIHGKGIVGSWTIDIDKANAVVASYDENDPRGLLIGLLISGIKDISFKEDGTCYTPDSTEKLNGGGDKCWEAETDNSYIFYGDNGVRTGTLVVDGDILTLKLDKNESTDDVKMKSTELEYSRVDK